MNEKILQTLLLDRTTGENIMWATTDRTTDKISVDDVEKIQPRYQKAREQQKLRTRERAEIFTPHEVCKTQNDLIADQRDGEKFIDAKFLEITCGEAPYLVSRYDVVTGESIDLSERVGLLDRKLRVINEYNQPVGQWLPLAIRAVKSCYGYEFQGDNLFLARKNVFETVEDFFRAQFNREPPEDFLYNVAKIISWNLWQMDGCSKFTIPYAEPPKNPNQLSLFDPAPKNIFCKIMDWATGKPFEFRDLVKKGARR